MEQTYTTPPREIFDVLHEFESRGGELPKEVELWWSRETAIDEFIDEVREADKRNGEELSL